MASRTTPASSRSSSSRSTRPPAARRRRRRVEVAPDLGRQVLGALFLILGVTLLIGLTLKGGQLTDLEWSLIAPWFSSMRWFLPFLLIPLGYYLERANGEHWDWQLTVFGTAVAYLAAVGLVGLVADKRGGTVGTAVAHFLAPLITTPGAGLVLSMLVIAGSLLAIDMSLPAVVAPPARLVGRAFEKLFRPAALPDASGAGSVPARPDRADKTGRDARGRLADERGPSIPAAIPNPGPTSLTFAPPAAPASTLRDGGPLHVSPAAVEAGDAQGRLREGLDP